MPPPVHGVDVDQETRCGHWRSEIDIIAIKMWCCDAYWACRECHDALAGHPAQVRPVASWDQPAILCGACKAELSVRQYMACGNRCPNCRAQFNPGCRNHYHLYFETV